MHNVRSVSQREIDVKRDFLARLAGDLEQLKEQGLYKPERVLGSPQQAVVRMTDGSEAINLCANNYLGLANHPGVREAARLGLDRYRSEERRVGKEGRTRWWQER